MWEIELVLADIAVGIWTLELITVPVKPRWLKQVKDMLECNPRFHTDHVTQYVCKPAIGRLPLQQPNWADVTSAKEQLIPPRRWPARQGQGQPQSVVSCNIPGVNPELSPRNVQRGHVPLDTSTVAAGDEIRGRSRRPTFKAAPPQAHPCLVTTSRSKTLESPWQKYSLFSL